VLTKVIFFEGNALLPDLGGAGAMPFKPPQWLNQAGDGVIDETKGDHAFPYSYVAGQTLNVAPIFTCNDPTLLTVKDLQIQGLVYDKNVSLKMTVPCIVLRIPSPALLVVLPSPANTNFAKTANFYNPLTIKWQFSTDGLPAKNAKKVWQPCGTSKNQVYITQAAPITSLLYQTVVEIGSREGAGLAKATNMLTSICRYFSLRRVQRASDSRPMAYYQNWANQNFTVPALLDARDGQCSSWCEIFKASLEAQGYVGAPIIQVQGVNTAEQFLVSNWTFGAMRAANPLNAQRSAKYPYINIPRNDPNGSSSVTPAAGQNYVWWSSVVRAAGVPDVTYGPEVNDAVDGVPGQNNARPAKLFNKHFVVRVNGQYYDPSYGLTYVNAQDLYKKAIAGFAIGRNVFYNGLINDGTAVMAYNDTLAITLIRTAPASALDPLKTEELDQKLNFIVQPVNTKQKVVMTPAVKVQLQDWNGNPVQTSGIPINIILYNVAGADPEAISGATAMTDATGVATFSNLMVNTPVASCKFLAQSTAALFVVSGGFKITP